jgi:NADH-quinone oxidoreductase subunit G
MPKLTINGTEIEVAPGTSILQAAEMLGYEIPRFCYHDRLSVPANCRMCLVEVKGAPKPVASCAMACGESMEVTTNSAMVKKARNGVMEMMLINHPLDCPICDQGGECDLQDQAMGYGFDRSRYHETKRAVKDKNFGPLIKTSMTRCIQCTRCARFGEEVGGIAEIGLLNRGEDVEISAFVQKAVSTEMSGNMIDICPVGALTSKPYAFQARPWELRKTETIDVHDAVGSNIRVDARGNEVMRVLPRLHEGINEEWINDRSRFAYDGLKRQRLDRPFVRDDKTGRLRPASWDEALSVVAAKLKATAPNKVATLVGDLCAAEEMIAVKDLMNSLGADWVSGMIGGLRVDASERAGYIFNSTIAGIEQADAILLVGTNPRWEATLVNTRIRKAWLAKRTKVGVIGENVDLTYPTHYIGAGAESLSTLVAGNHSFANTLKNAKNPMIILGAGALMREDGEAVQAAARDVAVTFNMVKEGWNGFNVLHTHAAQVAALDLGLTTVKSADDKKAMDVFYLLNEDSAVVKDLPKNAFVIYQGHHGDAGAARADVILPGAAYTEKDGLYVNTEGRVQMAKKAVTAPGEAREDWKILRALSGLVGKPLPYDNLFQLRQRLSKQYPHFAQIDAIVPAEWTSFGKAGNLNAAPFVSTVQNFYQTNVISRASLTMAKCVETFGKDQQAEAAE